MGLRNEWELHHNIMVESCKFEQICGYSNTPVMF